MDNIFKRFDVGIIADTFDPLTQLKVDCLIMAANLCEKLIVIIKNDPQNNDVEIRQRYRWVYETLNHFPHIYLLVVTENANVPEEYWIRKHKTEILKNAGPSISVWFSIDRNLEPGFPLLDALDIHETIRLDSYWKNRITFLQPLPYWVQPYFIKKVLITGIECTGKTTLATSLAKHYNTVWVKEAGRELSIRSGTNQWMLGEDNTDMLLQSKVYERELLNHANRVMFIDTDCINTLFYINYFDTPNKFRNANLAEAIADLNHYDLIITLGPDIPFIQDGDRSGDIASKRELYTQQLLNLYTKHGYHTELVGGNYLERYMRSIELIDAILTEN